MASQGFATVLSIPAPLAHSGDATTALSVAVVAPMTIVWADGKPNDSYAAGTACVSVYDGKSVSVDASASVWLVLFSQGTKQPWLVKEVDFSTFGTLVAAYGGGEFALYARIDGGAFYRLSQV